MRFDLRQERGRRPEALLAKPGDCRLIELGEPRQIEANHGSFASDRHA
jgi:hypothetical protein